MTREAFTRALYQGLGRTIAYAHTHDVTGFADLILDACLYNPIYDRQTGVDRAPYLAELIALSGAETYLRSSILAALADPGEEMDEELLFDLGLCFAQGGDVAARQALLARFLDNVSSGELTGYSQMIALDGDEGLRLAVEQIGAALLRAVEFDYTWLISRLLTDLDTAFADEPLVLNDPRVVACREATRLSPAKQAASERRQALRDSLPTLSYEELQGALTGNELPPSSLRRWAEHTTEDALRRAADALLASTEPNLLRRLLMIFDVRDFPDGHAPLLPLLDSAEPTLAFRAAHALARFRHPELRAQAERLIAHPDTLELGLILLVGNHEPGDYALLAALTAQYADDDDQLHAIVWRTHELFSLAPSPAATELLRELYELGPCAQCRRHVVEHLLALGALPTELAEECRFDASERVQALVGGQVA